VAFNATKVANFNAILLFFLPPRGKFRATFVAYQCHATFIFAKLWQFRATLLSQIMIFFNLFFFTF